jgi:hypothetical protein
MPETIEYVSPGDTENTVKLELELKDSAMASSSTCTKYVGIKRAHFDVSGCPSSFAFADIASRLLDRSVVNLIDLAV